MCSMQHFAPASILHPDQWPEQDCSQTAVSHHHKCTNLRLKPQGSSEPSKTVAAAQNLPEHFKTEIKSELSLPQRLYYGKKIDCGFLWQLLQLLMLWSEEETGSMQSMYRSDTAHESASLQLWDGYPVLFGNSGKTPSEHHIPRQKLLIVCFLKEKVCTDLCVCTPVCSAALLWNLQESWLAPGWSPLPV